MAGGLRAREKLTERVYPTLLSVKWVLYDDQTEVTSGQTKPAKNLGCTRPKLGVDIVPEHMYNMGISELESPDGTQTR